MILENVPEGFEEGIQYGMIGYYVPHRLYPAGYHCDPEEPLPFAGLRSAKNHMALYMMSIYGDEATARWFRKAYLASGKKLDMGKACICFKKLDDLPLDVIGQAVACVSVQQYVARCESDLAARKKAKKKTTAKKKK